MFPIITRTLQESYEKDSKDSPDSTPEICGYYGRACRQIDKEEGASRMLCNDCSLAKYCEEYGHEKKR